MSEGTAATVRWPGDIVLRLSLASILCIKAKKKSARLSQQDKTMVFGSLDLFVLFL